MSLQIGTTVRDAILDAIEATIGTTPILKLRTGSPPANCAAADTGTVLATMTLPSDWMNAASSASKTILGTWQDTGADASDTAAHFRIYDSGGTACHLQGTVTITGMGGEMTIDNDAIVTGQTVTVTLFTLNAGNA